MKTATLTSAEFRAELKRLKTNQSAFAAMADVPLRTVQSWALGERAIPKTVKLLIEKAEGMSTKEKLAAIVERLPEDKIKAMLSIIREFRKQDKEIAELKASVKELKSVVEPMRTQIDRQIKTNAWQADKIAALDKEFSDRRSKVQPFNA